MFKKRASKKGIALFMVLATLFMVIILGSIMVAIIASQNRLTHHQVSRIQAYYAAMAGVNYAFESLRTGVWPLPGAGLFATHTLCSGCTNPGDINEPDLPSSVQDVVIIIAGPGAPIPGGCNPPAGIPVCINATATFTYSP